MKSINELRLGFNDGEDFRRSENRSLFNQIFIKDNNLEKLLRLNTYFLIGEKGTGKTAYAVYLANNEYKNTRSQLKYIRETEYKRFINLKAQQKFQVSDYVTIWKVILLVLVASNIKASDIASQFSKNYKLEQIKKAIDDYYNQGFSPEISSIIEMVDNSQLAAEAIATFLSISAKKEKQQKFTSTSTQINLLYIYRQLVVALSDLRLAFNQFLFVDGIDIRPSGIEYPEYLECVKGLAEAIWELNNDIFAPINGSTGRIKIVVLLRPDIFSSLGLQNTMNKITNNSVYLDWRTTYPEHKESKLFYLSDKLLRQQQEDVSDLSLGEVWEHYFPWNFVTTNYEEREVDTPFIEMLRLSYSRPRDIITILLYLQEIVVRDRGEIDYFPKDVFSSHEFLNKYSAYVLGGIKDQLSFYYSKEDFELLMHFLASFKAKPEFDYSFFEEKYNSFLEYVTGPKNYTPPGFINDPINLLQFLYDANMICFIDDFGNEKQRFYWCYRERSDSNLSPKVKPGKHYRFHYGLYKSLELT